MLATVGTVIVLSFEQIAVQYISGHSSDEDHSDEDYNRELPGSAEQNNAHEHSGLSAIPISNAKNGTVKLTTGSNVVTYQHIRSGGGCEHNHAIRMIAEADSSSALLKAYMLEISVAVHSIIIGISIGTLSDPEDLKALESLIFAICLHQFIEGLGLGTVIKSTSMTLGPSKVALFILTFGLSVSIGVVIGIALSFIEQGHKSVLLDATTGVLNSLAAGILIYVALVEMVAEDFQSAQLAKRPELKKVMISALIAGNVSMGVLAIWA
jgi:zinc transporter 1/2/3